MIVHHSICHEHDKCVLTSEGEHKHAPDAVRTAKRPARQQQRDYVLYLGFLLLFVDRLVHLAL